MALVTAIGIYAYFTIKTAADYYISGRRGNRWQITGSLFATIMGGSAIMGTLELSQRAGWAAVWFLFSAAVGLLVLSAISTRVSKHGHFTLPELLLRYYGKPAEKAASLLIPIAWTGIVAAQIIAGAKILGSLASASYETGAVVSAAVFVLYTMAGGQKSILKTDLLQAFILVSGITMLVVLTYLNKSPIDIHLLPMSSMVPKGIFNEAFSAVDLLMLLVTYSVTFVVGPDIYGRIFSSRSSSVARSSIVITALLIIPTAVALTYLGISVAQPSSGYDGFFLPGGEFLPPWGIGLITAALLAAVMSSADTTLLSSSTILAKLMGEDLTQRKSLRLTRLFIVGMGAAGLVIALKVTSVLQSLLMGLSFFSGAFTLPILAGLAGWRVNQKFVLMAMFSGGSLALAGKILTDSYGIQWGFMLTLAGFAINFLLLKIPERKPKIRA